LGGFASIFDALSSEYAWATDETILDLRIGRLVQIMAHLRARKEQEMKLRHAELEWQTRAITTFISNTIEDNKAREQLVKQANKLTIMGGTSDQPIQHSADTTSERSIEEIMEHGDTSALEKNSHKKGLPFGM
jgi:hypothetical protein